MMLHCHSGESSWQHLESMCFSTQDCERVPGTQTEQGLGPGWTYQAGVETLPELQLVRILIGKHQQQRKEHCADKSHMKDTWHPDFAVSQGRATSSQKDSPVPQQHSWAFNIRHWQGPRGRSRREAEGARPYDRQSSSPGPLWALPEQPCWSLTSVVSSPHWGTGSPHTTMLQRSLEGFATGQQQHPLTTGLSQGLSHMCYIFVARNTDKCIFINISP